MKKKPIAGREINTDFILLPKVRGSICREKAIK
jgi:hypothetical protein